MALYIIFISLLLPIFFVSPETAIIASSQVDLKVLERDSSGRCQSMEQRESTRYEIQQIVNSKICGGPQWRRIAFINMTNTSHSCPTGLTLSAFSKRTCAHPHSNSRCFSTFFSDGSLPYSRVYVGE